MLVMVKIRTLKFILTLQIQTEIEMFSYQEFSNVTNKNKSLTRRLVNTDK